MRSRSGFVLAFWYTPTTSLKPVTSGSNAMKLLRTRLTFLPDWRRALRLMLLSEILPIFNSGTSGPYLERR
uniref:Putative secreted protein n=1 Tax=Ixodes ricinus TaxID=34613 RepID=A0A6B0U2H3_IXORI